MVNGRVHKKGEKLSIARLDIQQQNFSLDPSLTYLLHLFYLYAGVDSVVLLLSAYVRVVYLSVSTNIEYRVEWHLYTGFTNTSARVNSQAAKSFIHSFIQYPVGIGQST